MVDKEASPLVHTPVMEPRGEDVERSTQGSLGKPPQSGQWNTCDEHQHTPLRRVPKPFEIGPREDHYKTVDELDELVDEAHAPLRRVKLEEEGSERSPKKWKISRILVQGDALATQEQAAWYV